MTKLTDKKQINGLAILFAFTYMAKKDDDGNMAVGLWNTFYDEIYEPVVTLDMEYRDIEFINCTGRIEGNKVYLSPISAMTFAGFEVKR